MAAVCWACDAEPTQVVVRLLNGQILEERGGHARVVVLAGVDDDVPYAISRRERSGQRGELHEVRARTDYREENRHGVSWGLVAGAT